MVSQEAVWGVFMVDSLREELCRDVGEEWRDDVKFREWAVELGTEMKNGRRVEGKFTNMCMVFMWAAGKVKGRQQQQQQQ